MKVSDGVVLSNNGRIVKKGRVLEGTERHSPLHKNMMNPPSEKRP
jgi:hypothetical protein